MQNYFNDRNVTDYHSNMTEAETFTYAINHIFTNVMNPQDRLTVNDYDHIDQLHNTFCVDDTMVRVQGILHNCNQIFKCRI